MVAKQRVFKCIAGGGYRYSRRESAHPLERQSELVLYCLQLHTRLYPERVYDTNGRRYRTNVHIRVFYSISSTLLGSIPFGSLHPYSSVTWALELQYLTKLCDPNTRGKLKLMCDESLQCQLRVGT